VRTFLPGGPAGLGQPVHDTITRLALRRARWTDRDADQVVRGAIWNDDPDGLMFDDSDPDDPLRRPIAGGVRYAWRHVLLDAKARLGCLAPEDGLLARSHFGDLRFLHATATGAAPDEQSRTLALILRWSAFCWNVATGSVPAMAPPDAWEPIQDRFRPDKLPPASVQALFGARAPAATRLRALGSLLHLIQDSYAVGHVERRCLAAENRYDGIVRFRDASGQFPLWHLWFDAFHGGRTDARRVDLLPGGPDACDRTQAVIAAYRSDAAWPEVERLLKDDVFHFAELPDPPGPR
jgi:hypothetical protein